MVRETNEIKAKYFQDSNGEIGKMQNSTRWGQPIYGLQYFKIYLFAFFFFASGKNKFHVIVLMMKVESST